LVCILFAPQLKRSVADLLAAVLLYYITKRYQQIIFPEDMAESIDQFSPAGSPAFI
jgi:hypothetical protein